MSDQMLTIKDVATRLKIGLSTAYRIVEDGDLKGKRIGRGRGTIRVRPVDLERYINQPSPQSVEVLERL